MDFIRQLFSFLLQWWKLIGSIILVIVLFIFLLRSCSSDSTPDEVYRIGYDESWSPLNVPDKERNLAAFSSELLIDIANKENIEIQLVSVGPDTLMEKLDNHEFDAVLSTITPDQTQKTYYTFSIPYFLIGPVLVVPTSDKVNSFQDMAKKVVGVTSGISLSFNIKQPPGITYITYSYTLAAFADLDKGYIDGFILDLLPAYNYTKGFFSGRLKIASAPLTDDGIRLMVRRGSSSTPIIEKFNNGLDALKAEGEYQKLLRKWELYQTHLNQDDQVE